MTDTEYLTEHNAILLRYKLLQLLDEVSPECDIVERDRLLGIGSYQYLWHKANGFCESTSLMWARNHMASSYLSNNDRGTCDLIIRLPDKCSAYMLRIIVGYIKEKCNTYEWDEKAITIHNLDDDDCEEIIQRIVSGGFGNLQMEKKKKGEDRE